MIEQKLRKVWRCSFLIRGDDQMKKMRAIFIGDVRFDQCPVFELNRETDYFEMIGDPEFKYAREVVEEDGDFLIFEIENDEATLIER